MKEHKFQYSLAIAFSVIFLLVTIWDGYTAQLSRNFLNPNPTRHVALLGSVLSAGAFALILWGLLNVLNKRKLIGTLLWIAVAPALVMLTWDTITKNLVENGTISASWFTDWDYQQRPADEFHRKMWIFTGFLASLPFIFSAIVFFIRRPKKVKRKPVN